MRLTVRPAITNGLMGIIYQQVKALLNARQSGVPMDRVLMIGHQSLLLHPSELKALRKDLPGALADYRWGEYADRFLRECLGVSELHSLDYSPYEGADLLHDLNQPVPDNLKARFDVVIEAGSLEHIFNFPVAVANLMQMTRVGGTIFASTVSNNLCGHGFYQFSPELIFRVFTADNGFQLGRVLALEARYPGIELSPISSAFEVADPARVGGRVGLMTMRPIMLFFDARKTAEAVLFAKSPMQSDYAAAWVTNGEAKTTLMPQWIRGLPFYSRLHSLLDKTSAAHRFRNWVQGRRQLKQFSLKNQRVFKRI